MHIFSEFLKRMARICGYRSLQIKHPKSIKHSCLLNNLKLQSDKPVIRYGSHSLYLMDVMTMDNLMIMEKRT